MILDATLSYNAIREMQDTQKFLTNASEELELLGTRRHLDDSPLRHCVRLFSAKGKPGAFRRNYFDRRGQFWKK
jgi:hypothetical protein